MSFAISTVIKHQPDPSDTTNVNEHRLLTFTGKRRWTTFADSHVLHTLYVGASTEIAFNPHDDPNFETIELYAVKNVSAELNAVCSVGVTTGVYFTNLIPGVMFPIIPVDAQPRLFFFTGVEEVILQISMWGF